jgi:hypothetical protein
MFVRRVVIIGEIRSSKLRIRRPEGRREGIGIGARGFCGHYISISWAGFSGGRDGKRAGK